MSCRKAPHKKLSLHWQNSLFPVLTVSIFLISHFDGGKEKKQTTTQKNKFFEAMFKPHRPATATPYCFFLETYSIAPTFGLSARAPSMMFGGCFEGCDQFCVSCLGVYVVVEV